jgi:hypothetical protein
MERQPGGSTTSRRAIDISREEAASGLLGIAAMVRESMKTSGLLFDGRTGEFRCLIPATPEESRALRFRRLD